MPMFPSIHVSASNGQACPRSIGAPKKRNIGERTDGFAKGARGAGGRQGRPFNYVTAKGQADQS